MTTDTVGVWHALEMTCAAQDYPYEQYIDIHSKSGISSKPLSCTGYTLIGNLFDVEYMQYMLDKGSND